MKLENSIGVPWANGISFPGKGVGRYENSSIGLAKGSRVLAKDSYS